MMGETSARTDLLFVNPQVGRFPPEPVRFAGAYLTRKQSLWYDEGGEAGKDLSREPMMLRLASRLFGRS